MTSYNNLPPSLVPANATIQAFDNYYVKPIQLNAGMFDAIRGFFNSKGFDVVSAETIATAIMKQAQLGNYNPMQVLDSLKGLTDLELNNLIAEIMNYSRFKTSLLGSTVASSPYSEVTRNIAPNIPVPPPPPPPPPPPAVPCAPIINRVSAVCSGAVIEFTPSGLGYPNNCVIYQSVSTPGCITTCVSYSPINVTGLTNCQSYTFEIRAHNPTGWGAYSASSGAVVPHPSPSVPGIPSICSSTAGCSSVSVCFSPPNSIGYPCHPITYQVISVPGCISVIGSSSPINICGLTNCQNYTFKIRAHNPTGWGAYSAAGGAAMPHPAPTVPGAPSITGGTAGCSSAAISFNPPSSFGYPNHPITYQVISSPDGIAATGSSSPINVTGLTNCQSYTFRVRANNPTGWGEYSTASSATIPHPPPSIPGVPSVTTGTAGCTSASVSFTPSGTLGYPCHPITFEVVSVPGCISSTGSTSPINVVGLTNCQSYTFKARAHNPTGYSAFSVAGGATMPHPPPAAPGAPTIGTASITNCSTTATITFTTGTSGYPATCLTYQVISVPGNITACGSASPICVPGLTVCTPYQFKVRGHNPTGWGCYSGLSNSITPIVVPYSWSSSGANITMIPYGSGDQYLIAAVSQSILSSNPWKTVVEGGSGGPVTVASGSSFFPVSKGILNGSTRYTGFWYAHVTIASQDNTYINVKSYVAVIADAIANNQYTGPIPTI